MAIPVVSIGVPDERVTSKGTATSSKRHETPAAMSSYFTERNPVLRAQAILVVVTTLYCVAAVFCYMFQIQIVVFSGSYNASSSSSSSTRKNNDNVNHCPPPLLDMYVTEHHRRWANVTYRRRQAQQCSSWKELNVLVVVPGMGEFERISVTKKSIEAIRDSLQRDGSDHGDNHHGFGCLIYVYKDGDFLQQVQQELGSTCHVVYNKGLWTHHMKRVPPLTNTTQGGVKPYTHVAILMDDVDVSDVDMADFLHLMAWSKLGVVTPAIQDQHYPYLSQRTQCLWHRTDFVDILFNVFRKEEWMCWQDNIDVALNNIGWGMDSTFRKSCNSTMGVIDTYQAYHREFSRSYPAGGIGPMQDWIERKTGQQNSYAYFDCATKTRPNAFEECAMYADGTPLNHTTVVDWEC